MGKASDVKKIQQPLQLELGKEPQLQREQRELKGRTFVSQEWGINQEK